MKTVVIILIVLTGLLMANKKDSVDYVFPDTIVVTGSRIPTKINEVTRSVSVINKEMIETLPVHDIDDILKTSAVEVNERGMGNVQADLSVRGSTFNQVSVLWDGININDPQTGHFFANIPAPFSAVERVEIISGGNSALYGAQAFGGIVSFIPAKFEKTGINAYYNRGSFNTAQTGVNLGYKSGKVSFGNYFEYQESDGIIDELEYKTVNNFMYASINFDKSFHKIGLGYQEKEFGALDFYAPTNSFEENKSVFLYMKNKYNLNQRFYIDLNLHYRFHKDEFILLQNNPLYYKNNHKTNKIGGDFNIYYKLNQQITVVSGLSYGRDHINSKGIWKEKEVWVLGKRNRINKSIYSEGRYRSGRLLLNAGYRLDYNSFYSYVNSPSFDAAYFLNSKFKVRASYSHSYRAPDFTELYYRDDYNVGNVNLKTEKSDNYEIGIDYFDKHTKINLTYFLMDQLNPIDWISKKSDGSSPFYAENFSNLKNSGIEFKLSQKLSRVSINALYQYLNFADIKQKGKYFTTFTK
ncbi:MAG: TonB-dependent receptor, partial [Calditrichia bacterium]|nr:TonB-dependent receptor [Calditrichia bacterium]